MKLAKTETQLRVMWDFCLVIGPWTLYVGIGRRRPQQTDTPQTTAWRKRAAQGA